MELSKVGFSYTVELIGRDGKVKSAETVHNLIPTAALNYLLDTSFRGGSAFSTWYLSLYTANRTPVAADTMATLMADCSEDTVYTTTGNARQTITFSAAADGELLVPSANVFEFASAATIRGGFISSSGTRGSTAGLLMSAVLFSVPKTPAAGESLRVPVGFSFYSV